ncbi:MAG: hypothetical protein ABIH18_01150, partial [Candidatus Omnitrophota bacterium]
KYGIYFIAFFYTVRTLIVSFYSHKIANNLIQLSWKEFLRALAFSLITVFWVSAVSFIFKIIIVNPFNIHQINVDLCLKIGFMLMLYFFVFWRTKSKLKKVFLNNHIF